MLENYPDVLNTNELCKVLRISKKTAYTFLREGKVPCRKIGRAYKIAKEDVIFYLLSEKN